MKHKGNLERQIREGFEDQLFPTSFGNVKVPSVFLFGNVTFNM